MKTGFRLFGRGIPVFTSMAIAGLLLAVLASGCGQQTGEANRLVEEVNTISLEVEPKFAEVEELLQNALVQLSAGQYEEQRASLARAQELLDEIIPEINRAKAKTDEAATLNISESYRQYLTAKSRGLDASLALTETSREFTAVFLADPAAENPETLTRIAELQGQIQALIIQLNEAEIEARRIAEENAGEIEP